MILIATLEIGLSARLVLALMVAVSAWFYGLKWIGVRGTTIVEAILWPDDTWTLTTTQGSSRPARVTAVGLLRPWLTIVCLRTDLGHSRVLLLRPDCVDPDAFRRLRVRLRFQISNKGG